MTDDEILDAWDKAVPHPSLPRTRGIIAFARAIAAAEREACARKALDYARRDFNLASENADRYHAQADWAERIAAAIRARSET